MVSTRSDLGRMAAARVLFAMPRHAQEARVHYF